MRASVLALWIVLTPLAAASAQGVTTGAVSGRVVDDTGAPVVGASISVVNTTTGATSRATATRDGRYLVQGLEVGGPYSVTARKPGYVPQMRDGQMMTVSQNLTLDFRLERQTHRTFFRQKEIVMPPIEFKLLRSLLAQPGKVFSREELVTAAWPEHAAATDVRGVDVHIARLRKRLRASVGSDVIRTVRSAGYAFAPEW